jgi:glycosyltransferase involved in cell wall biosynthesis
MITSVPLVPPWDQGDKNLAYSLTAALPRHRFRVLTARDEPVPAGPNLDLEPVYHNRRPSLVQKAGVYRWLLAQMAPQSMPDLYHLVYQPYVLASWLNRLLPPFRRRPTLHTVPATANGRPLARHLFFADRVVALSEQGRHTLQQLGLENVVHIPPGIEVARWAALGDQAESLKARLGVDGHPTVLFPGHYGPGQGSEVMLRALPRLADRVPGVRIVCACRLRSAADQEQARAFRQEVERLGLSENVRFYYTVADMRPLIGASDLVVLPLETMRDKIDIPTTLLEALAAGKPIVISDLPPMSELVPASGGAGGMSAVGLTVPPGNAESLVQAVVGLLTEPGLRRQIGQQGQAVVRDRYNIRKVARQYEILYEELVQ